MKKIMERFKAGETLTEDDYMALAYGEDCDDSVLDDNYKKVTEIEGDDHRWTREMETIFKLGEDEYWSIPWRRGLTECQEDEFMYPPFRVKRCVKTVQIETWEEMRSDV